MCLLYLLAFFVFDLCFVDVNDPPANYFSIPPPPAYGPAQTDPSLATFEALAGQLINMVSARCCSSSSSSGVVYFVLSFFLCVNNYVRLLDPPPFASSPSSSFHFHLCGVSSACVLCCSSSVACSSPSVTCSRALRFACQAPWGQWGERGQEAGDQRAQKTAPRAQLALAHFF